MRVHIRLTPSATHGHMPINYNAFVSEFVYEAIQPDVPFAKQPKAGQQGIPYYTFSNLYIPEVQQEDRTLRFGQVEIELTISMLLEPEYNEELLARLRSVPSLLFPTNIGTELLVSQITLVDEATSVANYARFRMLSPLASPMWDAGDGSEPRYVHYGEPEFTESIRGILVAKYERWKGHKPHDTRFRFTLDEKYVQRRRGRISKLVTFHEGEEDEKKVKAIVAPFEVEGNPELIWLGYVAGFGEKNLLGFGCADLVTTPARDQRQHQERPAGQHEPDRRNGSAPRPVRKFDDQRNDRGYQQPRNDDRSQNWDRPTPKLREERSNAGQPYAGGVMNHHRGGGKFSPR